MNVTREAIARGLRDFLQPEGFELAESDFIFADRHIMPLIREAGIAALRELMSDGQGNVECARSNFLPAPASREPCERRAARAAGPSTDRYYANAAFAINELRERIQDLEDELAAEHEPETVRAMAKRLAGADRDHMQYLVHRRRAQGLTQADIAARLGVTETWVRNIEHYASDPRLSELRRYETAVLAVMPES